MRLLGFVVPKLQYLAGRAVQHSADGVERGETDGLGLARLQDGEVRQRDADPLREFVETHLATSHHDVEVHDNHIVNWFSRAALPPIR